MAGKKPSILIVDEEQIVSDLLCDELAAQGYLCATAFDDDDALAKLETQDFDVVYLISDYPGYLAWRC